MTTMPDFDPRQAHRFYSAHCYNETWRLLSLPNRSREQQDEMLALAYASSWHWSQREDIQPVNRSIALWLLSRVHAVLGDAPQARAYAEKCLQLSREASLSPFYIGYAHEALARAHRLSGDQSGFQLHLASARECLARIADDEERDLLAPDLDALAG